MPCECTNPNPAVCMTCGNFCVSASQIAAERDKYKAALEAIAKFQYNANLYGVGRESMRMIASNALAGPCGTYHPNRPCPNDAE